MAAQSGYRFSRYLCVRVILGGLLFLTACAHQSTTTFIKTPWPEQAESANSTLITLTPSCLDPKQVEVLLNKDETLRPLTTFYKGKIPWLIQRISEVINSEGVGCIPAKDQWKELEYLVLKDHEGLLVAKGLTKEQAQANLRSAIGMGKEVSVSITKPGSLALSTRAFPAEQEPGGVFAGLKERAQAAIIQFAQAFADKDKKTPEKAAESLLQALSPSTEPRVGETQRVELTVSAVVNSGTVEDRFDYLTAYLSLPSLPGPVNGRISLERMLLQRFQARNFGRPENKMEQFVVPDLRMALDSLRVGIETIDNLRTEAPPPIQLGTLKSGAELGLGAGREAQATFQVTGITAAVSAEREDKIAKELDKRSAWINKDRSLLRITQRGMQEATISGSISNLLTLKIPKTSLYLLDIEWDENKIEEVKSVKLKDVEQPLYASVDAIGMVLGTVRVTIPSSYPFKREPDGVAYTVVEDPVHLKLWRHRRSLWSLDLQELLPEFEGTPAGIRAFGIYSTQPVASQLALFQDQNSWANFIKALNDKKLRLEKHPMKNWYVIIPCTTASPKFKEKPELGEIWLGVEDTQGFSREFGEEEFKYLPHGKNLPLVIGGCSKAK